MKEWLEHSLCGQRVEWGLRDGWSPHDERGQQERRESVLSHVQGLMELSRMKMKPQALLWAWHVSGSLY